jgi:hypothetical protein
LSHLGPSLRKTKQCISDKIILLLLKTGLSWIPYISLDVSIGICCGLFVYNYSRSEVIVHFVDIGGIVENQCLNFYLIFHNMSRFFWLFVCRRLIYEEWRVGIQLMALTPPHFCACPKPVPRFLSVCTHFCIVEVSSSQRNALWFVLIK